MPTERTRIRRRVVTTSIPDGPNALSTQGLWGVMTIQTVHYRSVVISFVELNLLGYKRPVWQCDLDRDDPVCRDDREGHGCRVRFKS